jgi:site-specific DNA recombinase
MKKYYGYIRVSTIKQGEKGSSLTEQRDAILIYATKNGLSVCEFFEEQQTAAKLGRATFRKMLNRLKRGGADGLIMHKVDRGARNLADWAEIAALKDIGIDVHFAHEAIDLNSRGGRLSADIQAVVASDFIRNLRDEVKKGLYGRLKQGIYPFQAPVGYVNNGKGQLKSIDPVQGPLIQKAFELYANGTYCLRALTAHMNTCGLRNSGGQPFYVTGFAKTLKNPFYYGLLVVKGQSFVGSHPPLISKSLFDRCRARAEGRLVSKSKVWGKEYRFRGLLRCATCSRHLYAETQKGHVYYRCANAFCKGNCINEAMIISEIERQLSYLPATPLLIASLTEMFEMHTKEEVTQRKETSRVYSLRLSQIDARIERLTDLLIDGSIDQASYQERKKTALQERIDAEDMQQGSQNTMQHEHRLATFLELVKGLPNMAQTPNSQIFREYVKTAIPNFVISHKSIEIQWSNTVLALLDIGGVYDGAHVRNESRTCMHSITQSDEPKNYDTSSPLPEGCNESHGAHVRNESRTCIYYATHGDLFQNLCPICVTNRDNRFKEKMIQHGGELFTAIIYDKSLDQIPIEKREASGMAFATRFAQQKPKMIVKGRARVKATRRRAIRRGSALTLASKEAHSPD